MGNQVRKGMLFNSQAFHYQALRTMGHSAALGAAPGECLAVIRRVRDEDAESWYAAWHAMGERCSAMAGDTKDRASSGKALLRASNYYRTAEFFLDPDDVRRSGLYEKSVEAFERGLKCLEIAHAIHEIPYEKALMRAYFFPGDATKPLVLACGGYDSTAEEVYFWIGHAARERGYPCIIFEGPGQSGMLRRYGTKFTHEWEKPVGIVLDYFSKVHPESISSRIVLFGISMGTMLALRASAFEKRCDAVVGFGGFFNMQKAAFAQVPSFIRLFFALGWKRLFNALALLKASRDIGRRWALRNGCWTIGAASPFELVEKTGRYSLEDCADKITSDVLILLGERDHLIPREDAARFRANIKNARSFHEVTFRENDGAAEHCQAGALEQVHRVFFDWLQKVAGTSCI